MPDIPEQQPITLVKKSFPRAFIPKALTLLLLGGIFYGGVLLNLFLLELTSSQENAAKLGSLIFLATMIALGTALAISRAKKAYVFYADGILIYRQKFPYNTISNTSPQQNIWDKIFQTYSIALGNGGCLKYIPKSLETASYLQQMIAYARSRSGNF